MGVDFFKQDPLNQKLFNYLSKISDCQDFFDERKKSEAMFDEAIKHIKWCIIFK